MDRYTLRCKVAIINEKIKRYNLIRRNKWPINYMVIRDNRSFFTSDFSRRDIEIWCGFKLVMQSARDTHVKTERLISRYHYAVHYYYYYGYYISFPLPSNSWININLHLICLRDITDTKLRV